MKLGYFKFNFGDMTKFRWLLNFVSSVYSLEKKLGESSRYQQGLGTFMTSCVSSLGSSIVKGL